MNAHDKTTLRRMREWLEKIPDGAMNGTFPSDVSFRALLLAIKAAENDNDVEQFVASLRAADQGLTSAQGLWALIDAHLEKLR
jgi:hypothetical protein